MALAPTMMPSETRTPFFGRRRTRRGLVVVLAITCVLLIVLPALSDVLPGWLVPLSLLLVAALLVANMLLRFATHSLAASPLFHCRLFGAGIDRNAAAPWLRCVVVPVRAGDGAGGLGNLG